MNHHTLFLAVKSRQNSYHTIGLLEKQGEKYLFRYTKGVEEVMEENGGYNPLRLQFPETDIVYVSDELFPILTNRVMSHKRRDYKQYLEELGLEGTTDAFEILSVSLGKKVTDSYEVFPKLVKGDDGEVQCDFILRSSHVEDAPEHIAKLQKGDELDIEKEEKNAHTGQPAFKVLTKQGDFIGYCPRYLVKDIMAATEHSPSYEFSVKGINGTEKHPKVLISMNAYLNGYEPMSSKEYQPITVIPQIDN